MRAMMSAWAPPSKVVEYAPPPRLWVGGVICRVLLDLLSTRFYFGDGGDEDVVGTTIYRWKQSAQQGLDHARRWYYFDNSVIRNRTWLRHPNPKLVRHLYVLRCCYRRLLVHRNGASLVGWLHLLRF